MMTILAILVGLRNRLPGHIAARSDRPLPAASDLSPITADLIGSDKEEREQMGRLLSIAPAQAQRYDAVTLVAA